MKVLADIMRRTLYMGFFIILIPLGAYTIHNGSSATVALVSYLFLSIVVPLLYLSSKRSGFGPKELRIGRILYIVSWGSIQVLTYKSFFMGDFSFLWNLPTAGRDIAFILAMYVQVVLSLTLAYVLTRILRKGQ